MGRLLAFKLVDWVRGALELIKRPEVSVTRKMQRHAEQIENWAKVVPWKVLLRCSLGMLWMKQRIPGQHLTFVR